MAKASKKKRKKYLELLSANLRFFYPKLSNVFMCPVCLRKIDLRDKAEISDAHIIPKAAGGNRKTFLCKKCNNDFGSKQDKWFGELIRLIESEENIIQTKIKRDSFFLCDKRVRGTIKYTPEKGMEILAYGPRNPPEINDYVLNQFPGEKKKTLTFSLPILQKKRMISVGFLTAAYLLWFDSFGYSWTLQSHLDQIREQILFPDKTVIKNIYVAKNTTMKDKSCIGVTQFSGYSALAAGFSGHMVMIPPIYCPDLYAKTDELTTMSGGSKVNSAGFYPMHFTNKHFYDVPVCLIFDNRIMFAPDAMIAGRLQTMAIYSSSSDPVFKFSPCSTKERHQRLSQDPESEKLQVKMRGNPSAKYFDI